MRLRKSIALGILIGGLGYLSPVFSAKIIVQPVQNQLFYACPFDADILIDTQGENIRGFSLNINLLSGLSMQGFIFGDLINLSFPVSYSGSKIFAYGFKFPGTFSGTVKLATLRLMQNEKLSTNSLQFDMKEIGDTTDLMDVYYDGGSDALKAIENKTFVFGEGNCIPLSGLSGDQLSTTFNQQGHLLDLYKSIDDYVNQKEASVFGLFVERNLYYIVSILILVVLLIIGWVIYRKHFKRNPENNV